MAEDALRAHQSNHAADRAGPAPAAGGWRFMALLIFTQIPATLGYTIPLPLLASMAHELAHSAADASLVKLVSGVLGPAMAIGAALGGWLADRIDRRLLLTAMGAVYLVSGIAPFFIDNLAVIVGARFCLGLVGGGMMAIGLTMVGDYLPEHKRAGTIGMLSALNMVASLLSLPVAGFVGNAGWRAPFLLYLVAAPIILLASPGPLPAPGKSADAAPGETAHRGWPGELTFGLLLLALCAGIILTIPGIYVSFHLATVGLGATSVVGVLMMLNSTVAAVTSSLLGKGLQRFSPKGVFCAAFGMLGIGLIILAFAPNIFVALPALLLMGAGMGWLAPILPARVVDTVEEGRRGAVMGAIQGASSAAPIVGLTLLEPFVPTIGTKGVMLLVGVLATGLAVGFLVRRPRPGRNILP